MEYEWDAGESIKEPVEINFRFQGFLNVIGVKL